MMSFECRDCRLPKSMEDKYIWRFHNERAVGPLGRDRRSKEHTEGDQFRCSPCHQLISRTQRVMGREGLQGDWVAITKDARIKFMQTCADKFDTVLKTQIRVLCERGSRAHARAPTSDSKVIARDSKVIARDAQSKA